MNRLLRAACLLVAPTLSAACTTAETPASIEAMPPAAVLVEDPELLGIKDLRATDDGGVVVLSRYSPYLRWYDAAGQLLCVSGFAGDGPGEFRYPWAFVRHASAPMVSDPNHRRMTTLRGCREEPTLLRFPDIVPDARRDLQRLTYGDPFQVAFGSEGFIASSFPAPINQAHGLLPAVIVQVSAAGVVQDTLADFRAVPGRDEVVRGAWWLIPIPLWDTCPGGDLVVYDGVTANLTVIAPDGVTRRAMELPKHLALTLELSTEDVRRHVRHWLILEAIEFREDTATIDAKVDEAIRMARAVFGRTAPTVTRILCDDRSRIWLQEFDLTDDPTGRSARWTVLDAEGVRRVRYQPEFRVLTIAQGRALGVLVDPDGVETLAAVPAP